MIPSPRRPVSPETQRLYKANWASFEDWCGGRALTTLPADPATVAAFLTEAAPVRWAAAPRRPPPAKPSALIRMATRCPRDVAGLSGWPPAVWAVPRWSASMAPHSYHAGNIDFAA